MKSSEYRPTAIKTRCKIRTFYGTGVVVWVNAVKQVRNLVSGPLNNLTFSMCGLAGLYMMKRVSGVT